jgi:hypothetical protein
MRTGASATRSVAGDSHRTIECVMMAANVDAADRMTSMTGGWK